MLAEFDARTRWVRHAAESGRPVTSLLAGIATAYPAFVAVHSHQQTTTLPLLLAAAAMALITAAGFLLNDVADVSKDAAAGKRRAVAMGLLPSSVARHFALGALALALCSALPFATPITFLTFSATATLVVLYSSAARKLPLLKNAYVALLCTLPIIYGFQTVHHPPPLHAVLLVAAFIVFRELILDVADCASDATFGIATVAIRLGPPRATRLAWMGMLIVPILGTATSSSSIAVVWFGLTFLTIGASFLIHSRHPAFALGLTRLSLLTGVFAIGGSA